MLVVLLQIVTEEEPRTYKEQIETILRAFKWTDAEKPSTVVNKAAQMWYYGMPVNEVCTFYVMWCCQTRKPVMAA
jgi:hypothetical protein